MKRLVRLLLVLAVATSSFSSFLLLNDSQRAQAAPNYFNGELTCPDGSLGFRQTSDSFASDPNTDPNTSYGALFGVLWAESDDDLENFYDGTQLPEYRDDYYLSGSCNGTSNTGALITFGAQLYPRQDDPHIWDGFTILISSAGYTNYAAVTFTFSDDYANYTISKVTSQNSTSMGSLNDDLVLEGLSYTFPSNLGSYSAVDSFQTGSHPTTSLGDRNYLEDVIDSVPDQGGNPGNPPPAQGCTPQPLCDAQIEAVFVNAATIRITSIRYNDTTYQDVTDELIFFDNNLGNADEDLRDDLVYRLQNEVCETGQYDRIDYEGNNTSLGSPPSTAVLRIGIRPTQGGCVEQEASISISNPAYTAGGGAVAGGYTSRVMYQLIAADTIRRVDGENGDEFTYRLNTDFSIDGTAPADAFVRIDGYNESATCRDYLAASASPRYRRLHQDRGSGDCGPSDNPVGHFVLANEDGTPVASPVLTPPDAEPPADPDDTIEPTCESAIDNGLGWLICPLIEKAFNPMLEKAEEVIREKLTIGTAFLQNENLRNSWLQIARISSGMLVIAGLIMIISTALGSDLISSYSLKKILPRLAIGAIGIWLSWTLASTYVMFMNDLGRGVGGLLWSPWNGQTVTITDDLGANQNFTLGSIEEVDLMTIVKMSYSGSGPASDITATAVFSVPLIAFLAGSGGLFALLAAAVPLVGAMLFGFVFLALREVIIIFLIVIAPVAVAAWILPSTNKAWKLWSGTFNKLLLLFPIFMGIFAAGKIFAIIAASATQTNNGFIEIMIPTLAYAAPFFFLPAMYKMAGSVFQNLTGMMNNKGKGVFDKLRGGLDGQAKLRKDKLNRERQLESLQRIGQGNGGLRDRWRTGSFGPGLAVNPGTRRALRRAQERTRLSGLAEYQKEQDSLVAGEMERFRSDNLINDRDALRAITLDRTQSVQRRQAAIQRLAEIRDEGGLRAARAEFTRAGRTQDEARVWERVASSREFVDATRESAPELVRNNTGANAGAVDAGSWNNITAEGVTRLSAESIRQFFTAQQAELNSGDAARIADANRRIADMHAALQAAVQSDTHRAALRFEQTAELRAGMLGLTGSAAAATATATPGLYAGAPPPPVTPGTGWTFNVATGRYEKA